jgi:hypothetical protein
MAALLNGADDRVIEAAQGTHATPGAVLRMIAAACLIGATLGAQPLRDWAESLNADNTVSANIIGVAQGWDGAVSRFGGDRPYRFLHEHLKLLQSQHFSRNAP